MPTQSRKGFTVRTSVLYADPEEVKREPTRRELWAFLGALALLLGLGFFTLFGMYEALRLFWQRMEGLL